MKLEVILIIVNVLLAAFATYQMVRASRLKKEVGNQEFLVEAKDDIIRNLNSDKKMLKSINDAGAARNKELEDQVSMLVSQINQTGVKRNGKGQFEKVN